MKKIIIGLAGLLIGIAIAIYGIYFYHIPALFVKKPVSKQVIGFLPYWQVSQGDTSYMKDITTLAYFALKVDGNGHIIKLSNPQEEDQGWYNLESGNLTATFSNARKNNVKLSLMLSSGGTEAINQLVANPQTHAKNLMQDIAPLMKKYHFQDLNVDVEYTAQASSVQRTHFTQFISDVKQQLEQKNLGTLSVEISPTDSVNPNLIDVHAVSQYANAIVIMAYDYHSSVSFVTGPVAPLNGAGTELEYDVTTAVEKTMQVAPAEKIILGMPLYGYEWETLSNALHSAIIPGTGVLASNKRMQSFLPTCTNCSAFLDAESQEEFVYYQDPDTGSFHQFFFPTQQSLTAKINLAKEKELGGVALWALGYEGDTMLNLLISYK